MFSKAIKLDVLVALAEKNSSNCGKSSGYEVIFLPSFWNFSINSLVFLYPSGFRASISTT
nr:hypothetical protein [Mycoplasmopsis bovis]